MTIKAIYSSAADASAAVGDLKKQAGGLDPRLVVYFASSRYAQDALSGAMKDAFGEATIIGCSTAGEIVSGKMLKSSVVAMVFDSNTIADVGVQLVENVKDENRVPQAFEGFAEHFKTSMSALDPSRYVGIILVDGLTLSEEKLMETIGDLTDLTFIGGSAGDDLDFKQTYVHVNGKSYSNAAVLAVVEPKAGFDVIKTQSFEATKQHLVATKVDAPSRTVLEFNEKPAAQAYAEAAGVSAEKAADRFMSNPLGLMVGDEPYIRSPQQINDGKMTFYCNIRDGMELRVMRSTDIVADTRAALEAKLSELGKIAGIVNFHCILRTLELEQKAQCDAYGEVFSAVPTVGFSTYGEEYIGHINQTSTMLVFK